MTRQAHTLAKRNYLDDLCVPAGQTIQQVLAVSLTTAVNAGEKRKHPIIYLITRHSAISPPAILSLFPSFLSLFPFSAFLSNPSFLLFQPLVLLSTSLLLTELPPHLPLFSFSLFPFI